MTSGALHEQHRAADRDPRRDADAGQAVHGVLAESRLHQARTAPRPRSASSGPSAEIVTVGAAGRRQQQHAHDALAVHLAAAAAHADARLERGWRGGRTGPRPARAGRAGCATVTARATIGLRSPPPRSRSDATQIAFRPCSRISRATSSRSRGPSRLASLISIGRLTPVITSTLSASRNVRPRFDGVPPNMSVRIRTPHRRPARADRLRDLLARVVHVVVPADRHRGELRQVADDRLRRVHQLGGELPVRDDDDANHRDRTPPPMSMSRCRTRSRTPVERRPSACGAASRRSSPTGAGRRCSRSRPSGSSCPPRRSAARRTAGSPAASSTNSPVDVVLAP